MITTSCRPLKLAIAFVVRVWITTGTMKNTPIILNQASSNPGICSQVTTDVRIRIITLQIGHDIVGLRSSHASQQ